MGPLEKRLTGELAIYLVRSCARAHQELPAGQQLDLATLRRWFDRAYREWHLTPRVDLAGRTPGEAIAEERATLHEQPRQRAIRPSIELYTDLPAPPEHPGERRQPRTPAEQTSALNERDLSSVSSNDWHLFADRLFGSWLDDDLEHL